MTNVMPAHFPAPPPECSETDQCRLWVGNLDHRLTEFSLLKILQKYGSLKKFDLMYHKAGPDQGKHRGYCFATYNSREEANTARQHLDGKMALSKKLSVKWAHSDKEPEIITNFGNFITSANLTRYDVPPCEKTGKEEGRVTSIDSTSALSRESKIQAIEAKLRAMDDGQKDFTYSLKPAAAPGTSKWCSAHMQSNKPPNKTHHKQQNKPYRRNHSRR